MDSRGRGLCKPVEIGGYIICQHRSLASRLLALALVPLVCSCRVPSIAMWPAAQAKPAGAGLDTALTWDETRPWL